MDSATASLEDCLLQLKGMREDDGIGHFCEVPPLLHLLILYVSRLHLCLRLSKLQMTFFLMICVSCVIVNVCASIFCLSYNIKAEALKHFASLTDNHIR